VVAPLAFRLTLSPVHTEGEDGPTVSTGGELTVIVTVWLPIQPPIAPVTVYVVVLAGDAVVVSAVVFVSPVEGAHEYVVAPLAVSATLAPVHIEGEAGITVIVVEEPTVIVTVWVDIHPLLVPVTV